MLSYTVVGMAVEGLTLALAAGAKRITQAGLLPLIALIIEPCKVLFINNALNHGVLGPLGIAEAKQVGKSIFFLLETNPGPGLGLLTAYWLFGKGPAKHSAPGAMIIHFLGGVQEIYFPYVLMNPLTIVAVVAGGFSADAVFVATHAGLVATPLWTTLSDQVTFQGPVPVRAAERVAEQPGQIEALPLATAVGRGLTVAETAGEEVTGLL